MPKSANCVRHPKIKACHPRFFHCVSLLGKHQVKLNSQAEEALLEKELRCPFFHWGELRKTTPGQAAAKAACALACKSGLRTGQR